MTSGRFKTILVANRGEIAVRVIRTCRELGIRTVAVYSTADRAALHVRMADEAYEVGPPPPLESYLDARRIIDVARSADADAVHPGYGFLSENASFAEACAAAGLTFIGPPASAIRMMGDKTAARALMAEAGVPVVPGSPHVVEDAAEAATIARDVGFPVLIKAAAGGGGKGMRLVEDPARLTGAFEAARSEARSSFGDGRVFVEKYVVAPRHVEFQILADMHGNVVHLFERECSIQRRHQKVIEEAPSPILTPELRARMGAAAVEAARACGYVGAGTVEFLVDQGQTFYFMEMNTRLQVEHPVTEWITGIDLVAQQIHVAEGAVLDVVQEDLSINGHAFEARVYAEDPANDFLPDPGDVVHHVVPSGFGVRVDSGIEAGGRVEVYYDPLISKVTAWGRTRDEAIRRMLRALAEYEIVGVHTTIPFCRFVLEHDRFVAGDFSTHFVTEEGSSGARRVDEPSLAEAAALAAALHRMQDAAHPPGRDVADGRQDTWIRRREYR